MSRPGTEPREVLLMDFWPEGNRGDAAMQVALVQLVRQRLPNAHLTVMVATGANQWPALLSYYDATAPLVDDMVGGLRPWLIGPFESGPLARTPVRKVVSLAFAIAAVTLAVVWPAVARHPRLDRLLPRKLRRSAAALRRADLILWNCRNLRGESTWREPYEIWGRCYNARAGLAFGKQVACIGASIWPLANPIGRRMTRSTLSRMTLLTVRDPGSENYARSLLQGTPVQPLLVPDLALSFLAARMPPERRLPDRPRRLGLTIVDSVASGEAARNRYSEGLREYLRLFLAEDGTRVVIVPQVTNRWQPTSRLEARVTAGLDESRIDRLSGVMSLDELLDVYAHLDFLIATRMHSAIFALAQGTPAMTIPYVAGGKWGILDTMGAGGIDLPYDQVTAQTVAATVAAVWERRATLVATVRERLPDLAREIHAVIDTPVELFMAGAVEVAEGGPGL